MTKFSLFLAAALGLSALATAPAADARVSPQPTGVIGVDTSQLTPDYWVDRQRQADRVVLDRGQIALQNRKLQETDPSMHD
ncbi:MAG TPA: NlpC-P60 family protein, partial [Luteimonas sp.]|nr:NlpC-P60 family protein [Luteimonas sp.]